MLHDRRHLVRYAIAVALLGIAACGAYLSSRRSEHALSACMANQRLVQTALAEYWQDAVPARFPSSLARIVPRYLDSVPRCPTSSESYHYQRYSDSREGGDFVLECSGHHPGIQEGFPKASSLQTSVLRPEEFRGGDGNRGSGWNHPTDPDL